MWYWLTIPDTNITSGKIVTCYNCRNKISKEEIRITTSALIKTETKTYYPIDLSFHANSNCLFDWTYHNRSGKNLNTLPSFVNKVALESTLKLQEIYQQQINKLSLDGIAIKYQPSFNTFHQITGIYSNSKIIHF